ncbi:/ / Glycosyl transferase family 2 / 446783:447655 Forward [Candidatus Hepatoplasma crinochetorum]|uniref:/ / Glycosyl transferase family 2 / 446783:447655 Forward n=1 Tax=Candidatus Hepatoplasma crinochetorum TaxID=295596 RepID=A0A0G7ZMZ0_9MOLU|nr:/ / Glycosyl transferase family 2 / 446783:447655 Forward [Candidatus Hepatoplasma crinochetorum]
MSLKTLTFFYSIYNPSIIELNYISKFIMYIKDNSLLEKEIDVLIFDDTIDNKFKDYFKNLNVNVLNVKKNVKKNGAIFYSLNHIKSKYIKIVDPDDYLVFNILEKLVIKLKQLDNYDYIIHPFYKLKNDKLKYRKYKNLRYYNFNTIYSVQKIKKHHHLIKENMLYSQDQYLGMIIDLDSKHKKINIPFYIYNRNSYTSIWNQVRKSENYKHKNIDKILSDVSKSINFYQKYQNRLSKSAKPRFISLFFFHEKFKNKWQVYIYLKDKLKIAKFRNKLWLIYACFLKTRWI